MMNIINTVLRDCPVFVGQKRERESSRDKSEEQWDLGGKKDEKSVCVCVFDANKLQVAPY